MIDRPSYGARVVELAAELAQVSSVGALIRATLDVLAQVLESPLVSFTEIDLARGTAATALHPFLPGHDTAVHRVNGILREHPTFVWYLSQPDWSAVRLSDLISWEELTRTRLYREVLTAVGGQHMLALPVTPPADGRLTCFIVNQPERDFTDDELEFARRLQPALVTLYSRVSTPVQRAQSPVPVLTRREQIVLKCLAGGLTAEAIGRQLHCTPGTVRKHLQNIYEKLATHDRLTTVVRARDLGLIRDEDLSSEFAWNVRISLPTHG